MGFRPLFAKLVGQAHADDALGDFLVKGLEAQWWKRYVGKSGVGPGTHTVAFIEAYATRYAMGWRRRKSLHRGTAVGYDPEAAVIERSHSMTAQRLVEARETIADYKRRLPVECWEAVYLTCIDGCTVREAAARLGVTPETVWSDLRAARERVAPRKPRNLCS